MDIEQAVSGRPLGLEELLSGGVNFPPMVDIPPDADDETMVELAIALSLQEQVILIFMAISAYQVKYYFLPSIIKMWNDLPVTTRDSRSLNIFKMRINISNNRKKPMYYNNGSRSGRVLHTRLHMGSSSFNEHLYRREI